VTQPVRRVHRPTGAPIWLLPAPASFRAVRRRMPTPTGWTLDEIFGPSARRHRPVASSLRAVAPYLATPPGALRRALRAEGTTVVLYQEYEYARFDVCVALARALKVRVFATYRGGDVGYSTIEKIVRP
jgi:starch synthase